jgi:uncharacterized protein YndB with AHSA1/START domain
MDFRVGGMEILEGRFNESGPATLFEARFRALEPGRRLVYAYDLYHSGHFHSVTLSSLELEPQGPIPIIPGTRRASPRSHPPASFRRPSTQTGRSRGATP